VKVLQRCDMQSRFKIEIDGTRISLVPVNHEEPDDLDAELAAFEEAHDGQGRS